jgi:predicted transposase/invertase (TIGR01784 family)
MDINDPHDGYFKKLFEDKKQAQSFIENFLPETIKLHMDLTTIELEKDSFVDTELKKFFSDLIYRIKIKEKVSYLYILIDHKSYPDKWIAFNLARYVIKIWEREIKKGKSLPAIIPCVFYHGRDDWKIGLRLSDLYQDVPFELKKYMLDFEYQLFDITKWTDDNIKGTSKLVLGLRILKHIFDNPDELQQILNQNGSLLKEIWSDDHGKEFLESFLRYLFTSEIDIESARKVFVTNISQSGGDFVMSTAEKLIKQGLEKGLEEGLEKGKKEKQIEIAKNMLEENADKSFISKVTGLHTNEIEQIELESR